MEQVTAQRPARQGDRRLALRSRRVLRWSLGLCGLCVVVLGAWTINYSYYNHRCFQAKQERGCERFVPMEKWVCGHELPQTMLLGGCGMVAARYSFGVGVPKDLAQSIAYSRRRSPGLRIGPRRIIQSTY